MFDVVYLVKVYPKNCKVDPLTVKYNTQVAFTAAADFAQFSDVDRAEVIQTATGEVIAVYTADCAKDAIDE